MDSQTTISGDPRAMILPTEAVGIESVRAHRAEVLSALRAIRDPQARFQWLVERARTRPPLPVEGRRDEYRVTGCQVRLWWLQAERDGRRWFASDSDAVTLKALTGLLAECYSGEELAVLQEEPVRFLEESGLLRQLAESRRATVLRVAVAMGA
jgi:sulfur transfer protein SufE